VQPGSPAQLDMAAEEHKFNFYNEMGFYLPIEPDTTPRIYQLCQSIKERLHVRSNVLFCLGNRTNIAASCNEGNDDYPSVIRISSGAVNTLSDSELSFIIGHELGHVIMHNLSLDFFYEKHFETEQPPHDVAHLYHVHRLLSELEADRYGYLACGNLEDFVSFKYRSTGGIDVQKFGVPASMFLEANHRQAQLFMNGGWLGDTHPANALRIEAIHAFATSTSVYELNTRMEPIIQSIFNCND